MSGRKTFTIIKPDAVAKGLTGLILDKILKEGFKIISLEMKTFSRDEAEKFYAIHKGKSFYEGLIDFMTSGPVIGAILDKENAISDFRKIVGATNPIEASEGTIRKLYGENNQKNAIHASDSDENAIIESKLFFEK